MKALLTAINRVKAALLSGKKAAFWSMFYMGIGPFTRILDSLILKHFVKKSESIPTTFIIVSNQRSGSTFTFQLLSRLIPCTYHSNLHALFPHYASSHLQAKNAFGKNLKGFKNFYGHTAKLNDTNEGNGSLSHLFEGNPSKEELRSRFSKMAAYMKGSDTMPLLFKNVSIYQHVEALHEAVPEVKFIYLKRNEEQVIQSMLKAHYELGYYNAVPESIQDLEGKIPAPEFITKQFIETEKIILEAKAKVDSNNWIEWSYEDLCEDCENILGDLLEQHTANERSALKMDQLTSPLKASFSRKVSEQEEKIIQETLKKLNNERA